MDYVHDALLLKSGLSRSVAQKNAPLAQPRMFVTPAVLESTSIRELHVLTIVQVNSTLERTLASMIVLDFILTVPIGV